MLKKTTNLFIITNCIVQSQNIFEYNVQNLVLKADKKFDNFLSEIAILKYKNICLNIFVEKLYFCKKQCIQKDSNKIFTDIARIINSDNIFSRHRQLSRQVGKLDFQDISYIILIYREKKFQYSFHI